MPPTRLKLPLSGPNWALSGPNWPLSGLNWPLWGQLGPFLAPIGPLWAQLGPFGPIEPQKEHHHNLHNHAQIVAQKKSRFLEENQ